MYYIVKKIQWSHRYLLETEEAPYSTSARLVRKEFPEKAEEELQRILNIFNPKKFWVIPMISEAPGEESYQELILIMKGSYAVSPPKEGE